MKKINKNKMAITISLQLVIVLNDSFISCSHWINGSVYNYSISQQK